MIVSTNDENYKNIANAIRVGNASTTKYAPSEMSRGINDIVNMMKSIIDGSVVNAVIPQGVEKIKSGLFLVDIDGVAGNDILKTVSLPSGVKTIEQEAFYQCRNLTEINLPDTIERIGKQAFFQCNNVVIAKLPENLKKIGNRAFLRCYKVTFSEIPASVENIDENAFMYCDAITQLTFKGTPLFMHANALANMSKLTSVRVPWDEGAVANAPWGATNATIVYNYV